MKHKKLIGKIAIYTVVILVSATFAFPLIWLFRSSFMSITQIFKIPPEWIPNPFQPQNYVEALTDVPFVRYFFNTLLIIVVNLAAVILVTPVSAYAFSRFAWKGRDGVFFILLSSMMLPSSVTLIPMFLFWNSVGLTNTFWPLLIPTWFGGGVYNIFLLRQFMMTIPKEIDEAAYIDGANSFQILIRIFFPLMRPALITVGLFCFLFHWNDFLAPLIYLSDINNFTISIGLRQFSSMYSAQWHLLMAAASICVIPPITVFFIGQKFFIEGITVTGIKG